MDGNEGRVVSLADDDGGEEDYFTARLNAPLGRSASHTRLAQDEALPTEEHDKKREHFEVEDPKARRPVRYVYFLVGIAALNSANLGYDIGVIAGASLYIERSLGLSAVQVELMVGVLNFCAIGGAMIAHYVVDVFGRRRTFTLSCAVFVTGVIAMATAQSYEVLMLGRVITGVGVGIGLSVDPVYIAEIAPKSNRGELVTWSEISINIGILLGFVAGYAFRGLPTNVSWRVMLACGGVMPIILLVLTLTVMPESPRWLVAKGRQSEAHAVLKRLNHDDCDVQELVDEIDDAVRREKSTPSDWSGVFSPATPGARYAVAIGVGIATAQQIMAEEALLFYQPRILEDMGLDTQRIFLALIAMGVLKTGCIVISAAYLDKAGRRPLLLLSIAGMGCCLFGIGLSYSTGNRWGAVTMIWGYMMAFSLGIGPICWLLAAEVFPLQIRAKAMALATICNRVASSVIASSFLSWGKAMGFGAYFYFFSLVAALVWSLTFLFLPETKGKSLEEMALYFETLASPHTGPGAAPLTLDDTTARQQPEEEESPDAAPRRRLNDGPGRTNSNFV